MERRFRSIAKKGVRVYFYDKKDVDRSLDKDSIAKLASNGFAVTKDGTVWINKDYVDSGKLIDFNKTTQHEISHIVFGEDSEFQAQYLEAAYGNFLQEISDNGYLNDNEGIRNYQDSLLTFQEIARLNGYTEEEIQLAVDGALRGFLGDKFTDKVQAVAVGIGKKIAGEKGESVVKKLIEADKKFFNEEGRKVGSTVRKVVQKTTGKDTHKLGDKAEAKITQIQKNVKARKQEREKAKVQKAQQKAQEDRIYKEEKPKDLGEVKDFINLKGKLPRGTKIVFELENGQRVEIGSMEELKYGTPEEQALEKEYADRINANIREQETARREKNIYRLEILEKEEERLLNEQRSIFSTRTSPFGRITDALNLIESAKNYKDGVLLVNASKYSREVGLDYTAMGMEMVGKVETLTAMSRAGLPGIEFSKNTGSGASKSLNPNKVYGNSQQVFINDGTSGGTTIANQIVLANQNGMVIRQTNLHTGETLTRAINPVGDIVYSYSSYSSVVNPALLQIGRTTGQNLVARMNIPKNYAVTVYNPRVTALSTTNYFNTEPFFERVIGPQIEKQLRGMGITDVDKQHLVPKIDGTVAVGKQVDKALNNNLGYTFKTFDNFDSATGIATSVKSVNLNAPSYQDGYKNINQLSNKLNNDIGKMLDFKEYRLNGVRLEAPEINQRVLHIVVDNQPLTLQQQVNLQRTLNFARINNVEVRVTINMGTGGK